MNWQDYVRSFESAAIAAGRSQDYVNRCLAYARNLHERGLPVIYDQEHLAELVGYDIEYLRKASNRPSLFYRFFKIPKRSGSLRRIAEPLPSLKEIQAWILKNILYTQTVSDFAKAYVPGRSIRDNARFHRGQRKLLTVDVAKFFESIGHNRVWAFYTRLGYAPPVATLLTKLCCLNNRLPQGAPTSPALSNILMRRFDRRLSAFALSRQIRFTRYADDISFSGRFRTGSVIRMVRTALQDEGLKLNDAKTRLMLPHQRQIVTGIVVNRGMKAPREVRRGLRQAIHYISTFGVDSHLSKTGNDRANYLRHLWGLAHHVLFLDPSDRDALRALAVLRPLLGMAVAPSDL